MPQRPRNTNRRAEAMHGAGPAAGVRLPVRHG